MKTKTMTTTTSTMSSTSLIIIIFAIAMYAMRQSTTAAATTHHSLKRVTSNKAFKCHTRKNSMLSIEVPAPHSTAQCAYICIHFISVFQLILFASFFCTFQSVPVCIRSYTRTDSLTVFSFFFFFFLFSLSLSFLFLLRRIFFCCVRYHQYEGHIFANSMRLLNLVYAVYCSELRARLQYPQHTS